MDAIPQIPRGNAANSFLLNSDPRCATVVCLDDSGSMQQGGKVQALNAGMQVFAQDVATDPLTLKRAEFSFLTFGPVREVQSFATMDQCTIPHLNAQGDTPLGEVVLKAIDLVEDRRRFYKANLVQYYRPIIFLFTDGASTDDTRRAEQAVADGEQNKRFTFLAVGVDGADFNALARLSAARPPLKLTGAAFGPMFKWLSATVKIVSHSQPQQTVALPNPAMGGLSIAT